MGFIKKLSDEFHDRNLPENAFSEQEQLTETISPKEQKRRQRLAEAEKRYPKHPDYIALNPGMTERKLLKQPACRYYGMIIGFGAGIIVFGLLNILGMNISQSAYIWFEILGLFAGLLVSKEILEVRWRIPFENGTPEQQKQAVERYLAEQAEELPASDTERMD